MNPVSTVTRRCAACGCTDDDCRRCIEKTGAPCYWAREDLCSACCTDVFVAGQIGYAHGLHQHQNPYRALPETEMHAGDWDSGWAYARDHVAPAHSGTSHRTPSGALGMEASVEIEVRAIDGPLPPLAERVQMALGEAVHGGPDAADIRAVLRDVQDEVLRARRLFPQPNALLAALVEEVGELAESIIEKPPAEIRLEAIQVAAMAVRIAAEGDPTQDGYRASKGLDPSTDLQSAPGII